MLDIGKYRSTSALGAGVWHCTALYAVLPSCRHISLGVRRSNRVREPDGNNISTEWVEEDGVVLFNSKVYIQMVNCQCITTLCTSFTNMARFYDHNHREAEVFEAGEKAWLDGRHINMQRPFKRFDNRWFGLFEIQKVLSRNAYRLKLPQSIHHVHPVFMYHCCVVSIQIPLQSIHSPPTQSPYLLMVVDLNMRWSVSLTVACITRSSNT
jgi:hypothetical protein